MFHRLLILLIGVGVCGLLTGCGSDSPAPQSDAHTETGDAHVHEAEHDHSAGPHGGHLYVLGDEEYHAELTHDEASHTVTVYLLGPGGKEVIASGPSEVNLQILQDGEFVEYSLTASDDAGVFSVVDENLCDTLLHSEQVKGRIRVSVNGQEYVGMIEHEAHDHAGHDDHTGHDH